jgi:hypothetical protein
LLGLGPFGQLLEQAFEIGLKLLDPGGQRLGLELGFLELQLALDCSARISSASAEAA